MIRFYATIGNGRPALIVNNRPVDFDCLAITSDDKVGQPDGTAANEERILDREDCEIIRVVNTPNITLFVRLGPPKI